MSKTRLALQVGQQVDETLSDLRDNIDGLKTGVQFFGPDALVIKRTGRTSGTDVSTSVSAFALKSYRCTFTAATLTNPYVEFVPIITVSGGTGFEQITIWPDPGVSPLHSRAWIVTLSNDSNTVTFSIAAVFKCTDTGSVTVVAA